MWSDKKVQAKPLTLFAAVAPFRTFRFGAFTRITKNDCRENTTTLFLSTFKLNYQQFSLYLVISQKGETCAEPVIKGRYGITEPNLCRQTNQPSDGHTEISFGLIEVNHPCHTNHTNSPALTTEFLNLSISKRKRAMFNLKNCLLLNSDILGA